MKYDLKYENSELTITFKTGSKDVIIRLYGDDAVSFKDNIEAVLDCNIILCVSCGKDHAEICGSCVSSFVYEANQNS